MAAREDTARALLERHGQTFADELGIDLSKGTPSAHFRLLCASSLLSARIGSQIAVEAARNLAERGWRTPDKLAQSTWEQRVKALNEAGYTRYQERTATMLGDLTDHLLERYGGDLRKLRDEAERDPKAERKLLWSPRSFAWGSTTTSTRYARRPARRERAQARGARGPC